jgi:arginase
MTGYELSGNGVTVLGVPSSAGAHHAGQDAAPAAMRAAGLVERLRSRGADVDDGGDLAGEVFTVDNDNPTHRSLPAVLRVARAVADATAEVLRSGRVPLLLGGDCTITLGAMAGTQRVHPDAGLAYFDGDADLSTPARTHSGVMDAMGIAHLLGIADSELARLDRPEPMLIEERLVMLGYDPRDQDAFDADALARHPGVLHHPYHDLRLAPEKVAHEAISTLEATSSRIVVHFDIDVVDSNDVPLGNFPHYGTGVSLETAGRVLEILCATPRLAAIVLTEVNPSYDPSGRSVSRYVETVAGAIATAIG